MFSQTHNTTDTQTRADRQTGRQMQTQTHTQVHTAYQCASTIVPSPVYHCRCTSVPVFARTRVRDSQCANTFVPVPLYQYPPVRVGQCANTCVPVPLLVSQPSVPVRVGQSASTCVPFPVTVWHCLFLFTYNDSDTRVLVAHASSGTKAAVVGGGGWRVVIRDLTWNICNTV